ncbi:Npt1/Npt2 family nucleotide transporter [Candidatus Gromoviella agglomerans]|uniref:Npt1/Npt2 family nucleotide transporter n=1 Tax=Candidatus Gromoviella agglomerans TaxID=2806609 RepID=UPI001E46EA48|nr:Npt1/Npt2 family nucleotide transporter [Candidatus Gromoviella agglomerans]UFX98326.1 NTP/NDP exchange transporter [Candidatus Gromoviella agglomerans]
MSSSGYLADKFLSSIKIGRYEFKKFFALSFIMFCMLFNYTILRDIKDVLINTLPGTNTELVPYIKGIFIVVFALMITILYMKLSSVFDSKVLFYWIIGGFLTFFTLFAFVLYPFRDVVHPSEDFIANLVSFVPSMRMIFLMFKVWSYILFYVMAELWGGTVLSLLFWQFSNDIVTSEQAKRYYPLFGIVSNFALILSGQVIKVVSDPSNDLDFDIVLKYLCLALLFFGVMSMLCHRYIVLKIIPDKELCPTTKHVKNKVKISLKDGLKEVFQSPYIALIGLMVFAYGMSINIIEIIWKKQLAIRFDGNKQMYAYFMGSVSQNTGIFVVCSTLVAQKILSKFKWFTGAVITPAVMFITGSLFIVFLLLSNNEAFDNYFMDTVGYTALAFATYVGAVQNIFGKGSKYILFDPTKEMAYIPLDPDLRARGKAAVDVVGGRLGKAGGSYLWIILLSIFSGNIISCVPYAVVVFTIVSLSWIFGVKKLSTMYERKLAEKAKSAE